MNVFTSLTEALEAAALRRQQLITLSMTVNSGRVTKIVYRCTFTITDEDDETTTELTVMTALLRQYGKTIKNHHWAVQFALGGPAQTFIDSKVASWIEKRAGVRDTVPNELVEQIETGTEKVVAATVAGTGRRAELEGLKVEAVRKLAASLKVAGAWKARKAELIDLIISAEAAAAS